MLTTGVPACALIYKFTGKERDSESGLDNFGARYNSSSVGRFMSPDPFNPFALKPKQFQTWISNPQRWNKYAYGLNNPITLIDPNGLNACGTNDDKTCKVTVTLRSRPKDKNGNYNDQFKNIKGQQDYNATAVVSVNSVEVGTFLARTVPSDSDSYPTVANGAYSATFEWHGKDPAIRLQPSDNIPVVGDIDPATNADHATGILIHPSGQISKDVPLGYTGMTRAGTGVSEGCQLICRSAYGLFGQLTGITPDTGARQKRFTVVIDTDENDPDQ